MFLVLITVNVLLPTPVYMCIYLESALHIHRFPAAEGKYVLMATLHSFCYPLAFKLKLPNYLTGPDPQLSTGSENMVV